MTRGNPGRNVKSATLDYDGTISTADWVTEPMTDRSARSSPAGLLEQEFAQERAASLGRLGRGLEAALAALAELDAHRAGTQEMRSALVEQASVALWHFIVQREVCGLRDMRHVLRDYGVPAEVAARMGATPSSPAQRQGRMQRP
jgi:hypothetical protein